MSRPLSTPLQVIDALGGSGEVAKRLGKPTPVVCNWRMMRQLPAHTYRALKAMLEAQGERADPDVWRMTPPPQELGASE